MTPAHVGLPLAGVAAVTAFAAVFFTEIGLPTAAVAVLLGLLLVGTVVTVRRALGSLAAGAGLRLAQPYTVGDQVRLWVPELDADVDAEVVRLGLANTRLRTRSGELVVPNTLLVRAAPSGQAA